MVPDSPRFFEIPEKLRRKGRSSGSSEGKRRPDGPKPKSFLTPGKKPPSHRVGRISVRPLLKKKGKVRKWEKKRESKKGGINNRRLTRYGKGGRGNSKGGSTDSLRLTRDFLTQASPPQKKKPLGEEKGILTLKRSLRCPCAARESSWKRIATGTSVGRDTNRRGVSTSSDIRIRVVGVFPLGRKHP